MLRSGRLRRTLVLTVVVALGVAVLPVTAVTSAQLYDVAPSAIGLLVAAYGLGNLTGALAVMARSLTGEADRLTRQLAAVVATSLAVVLAAPIFGLAVVAHAVTGTANAYFFAATLAARSEHAPREARGQVFIWVGALKITAGSAAPLWQEPQPPPGHSPPSPSRPPPLLSLRPSHRWTLEADPLRPPTDSTQPSWSGCCAAKACLTSSPALVQPSSASPAEP